MVCGARVVSDTLTGQKFVRLQLPLTTFDVDERRSARAK